MCGGGSAISISFVKNHHGKGHPILSPNKMC